MNPFVGPKLYSEVLKSSKNYSESNFIQEPKKRSTSETNNTVNKKRKVTEKSDFDHSYSKPVNTLCEQEFAVKTISKSPNAFYILMCKAMGDTLHPRALKSKLAIKKYDPPSNINVSCDGNIEDVIKSLNVWVDIETVQAASNFFHKNISIWLVDQSNNHRNLLIQTQEQNDTFHLLFLKHEMQLLHKITQTDND